jgi:hypothetical protein
MQLRSSYVRIWNPAVEPSPLPSQHSLQHIPDPYRPDKPTLIVKQPHRRGVAFVHGEHHCSERGAGVGPEYRVLALVDGVFGLVAGDPGALLAVALGVDDGVVLV